MKSIPFDPGNDLIIVNAQLWGPMGESVLRLVVDTGASQTIIVPGILDDLGYNPRDAEALTAISSPLGREAGYRIRVARLEALGYAQSDIVVHALDLGTAGAGIDGLLGLSFLRQYNYEVRSKEGVIRIEPA